MRLDYEKIIGQMIVVMDLVEGEVHDRNGNVEERYLTTRFRHSSILKADGPDRDLAEEFLAAVQEREDLDADGAIQSAIYFVHDYENGRL